jgi:transcriptional regulator GlxA family with amidase domain
MDLTLAMVKEDYGQALAGDVAKRLVVFLYRPGEQPQVSQALTLQVSDYDRFRDLHLWILNHLDNDLSIGALAKRAAMSVRNFSRRFRQSFGVTPAEFVMRARVEAACRRLEESRSTIEQVATECGFSSAELKMLLVHHHFGRNRWMRVLASLRSFRDGYITRTSRRRGQNNKTNGYPLSPPKPSPLYRRRLLTLKPWELT